MGMNDVPAALVFGTNEIGEDQKSVLRIAYGDQEYNANQDKIIERSCFRAYGKPLLTALLLNMIGDKLCALLARVDMPARQANDLRELSIGIKYLRDAIAESIGEDKLAFLRSFLRHLTRMKAMLQEGRPSVENPDTIQANYKSSWPPHIERCEYHGDRPGRSRKCAGSVGTWNA